MEVKVKAYGKINLMLDINYRRADGYHDLFMVMQSIDIYDTITISENKSKKISITCNIDDIPLDEHNIAHKAAKQFFADTKVKNKGINIDIVKRIPHAAGLAGGSADGAGVIVALNKIYDTGLTTDELCKIGVKIGADLPFCIKGGTLLAQGIGDVLSDLKPLKSCNILIVKPNFDVNTAFAYKQFDLFGVNHKPRKLEMLKAIQNGDMNEICYNMENVFEQFIEVPDRILIKQTMRDCGAKGVCMSGSGPTVFALFDDINDAKKCKELFNNKVECAEICKPVKFGTKIFE